MDALVGPEDFCCLRCMWQKHSGLKICREIDQCDPLEYVDSIGHVSLSFKLNKILS